MSKFAVFMLVNLLLVVGAGIVSFKDFKTLGKSLYWLLYPNIISMWSRKKRSQDFENTFRFEIFLVICVLLIGLNYLLFKYCFAVL
jgi:hypothetical protein